MSINWNKIAVAAAIAGMSYLGVATAQAAPQQPAGVTGTTSDCSTGGANAERCETNGSTALRTSPANVGEQRVYGPFISPDMVWIVAD